MKRHELKASIAEQIVAKANDQQHTNTAAKEGKARVMKWLSQPSATLENYVALQQAMAAVGGREQAVHDLKESIRRVFMHLKNANDLRRCLLSPVRARC